MQLVLNCIVHNKIIGPSLLHLLDVAGGAAEDDTEELVRSLHHFPSEGGGDKLGGC